MTAPRPDAPALRFAAVEACRRALEADPAFVPTADLALEAQGELGRGGMGVVHRVRDRRLGRVAALKCLKTPSPDLATRLVREAHVTARLDHPGIPPVYEAGHDAAGRPYMLMRVVQGESLKERIAKLHAAGPPSPRDARELLEALVKVGEAVAYAHAQGVVHRDLKPANIMLGRFGEVLVMDWGLARVEGGPAEARPISTVVQEGAAGQTQVGAIVGTLGYMPPEQASGEAIDWRVDVFALGAILVELLTGRPPIEGSNDVNKVHATVTGKIATPRQRRPELPADLDGIAARALAAQATRRTRSAALFVDELRAWLAGDPVPGHRYGALDRFSGAVRRAPLVAASAAFLVVLLAVAGVLLSSVRAARAAADLEAARAAAAVHEKAQAEAEARAQAQAKAAAEARAEAVAERAKQSQEFGRGQAVLRAEFEGIMHALTEVHQRIEVGEADASLIAAFDRLLAARVHTGGNVAEVMALFVASGERALSNAVCAHLLSKLQGRKSLDGPWLAQLSRLERTQAAGEWTPALERLVALGPADDEAVLWASMVRANSRGEFAAARVILQRATQVGRVTPRVGLEGARALVGVGDLRGAMDLVLKIEERAPYSGPIHANKGFLLLKLKRLPEAEAAYTRAIQLDPRDAGAFFNRGIVRHAGRLEGALADLTRAIELGHPTGRLVRAEVLLETGDPKRAEADLTAQLRATGDQPDALFLRGVARDRQQDARGAAADWRRVLELAPTFPRAAWIQEQLQRLGKP